MNEISYEESLFFKNKIYLDVRSPQEFETDHIPQAINLPLFDNEERKEIGQIYRFSGKNQAVLKGLTFFEKKLSRYFTIINNYQNKNLIIYCARGGMRSSSISSLIKALGFSSYKIKGGYKEYRHYVSQKLTKSDLKLPPLFILQGLTGVGKTELIKKIPHSIDLEDLAQHKGSLFGEIAVVKRTQKKFESLILEKIEKSKNKPYLLLEGESKKIGNLHIPLNFYRHLQKAPVILIKSPLKKRIKDIINEYSSEVNFEKIVKIMKRLKSKIGNKKGEDLKKYFLNKNLDLFVKILLEDYYDPLYQHSLKKIKPIAEIENINSKETLKKIKEIIIKNLK